ncbi:hypothetical protein GLYMA_12G162400v4 [Glycine max]|uniref:Uncharacterized protein n=2 Tax=Glycine subgen. Soja TaxID=1462606 RepID=A0A0R0HID4_SOYBN|nr:hypothetical protein GYH30_033937 [Glycine max]KRH26239.1 hypothetical protein GLYMA_12G162400v4 [Glycine max]RZB76100.1 hypothetical protein D0Y65_034553 [Glycine soja]
MVVDTSSGEFILQESMQKLHQVQIVNDVQFRRYCACAQISTLDDPLTSVGNFRIHDYAAREDVAVLLAQKLCKHTGKQIRDFNFYNAQNLETKLQALIDANTQLKM